MRRGKLLRTFEKGQITAVRREMAPLYMIAVKIKHPKTEVENSRKYAAL